MSKAHEFENMPLEDSNDLLQSLAFRQVRRSETSGVVPFAKNSQSLRDNKLCAKRKNVDQMTASSLKRSDSQARLRMVPFGLQNRRSIRQGLDLAQERRRRHFEDKVSRARERLRLKHELDERQKMMEAEEENRKEMIENRLEEKKYKQISREREERRKALEIWKGEEDVRREKALKKYYRSFSERKYFANEKIKERRKELMEYLRALANSRKNPEIKKKSTKPKSNVKEKGTIPREKLLKEAYSVDIGESQREVSKLNEKHKHERMDSLKPRYKRRGRLISDDEVEQLARRILSENINNENQQEPTHIETLDSSPEKDLIFSDNLVSEPGPINIEKESATQEEPKCVESIEDWYKKKLEEIERI